MDQDENTIEGEVVTDTSTPAVAETVDHSQVLINMEGMIKNLLSAIGRLEEEHKKHKEMLDDIFKNDPTYQEHTKIADEAAKVKKATKAQILKRPQAAELDNKVKSLKSEMKENQASLSDYLGEYQRMSGVNEIEDENGEVMAIVYTAKLVKGASRP